MLSMEIEIWIFMINVSQKLYGNLQEDGRFMLIVSIHMALISLNMME